MRTAILVSLLVCAGLCVGCEALGFNRTPDYIKPTIAVLSFENRAAFPLRWDLGGGMKDVLVHELMRTGRYRVIERPQIDSVVREIKFQHSGATRAQRRAQLGRLINTQYLIKGTVTDFGHVATDDGFLGLNKLNIFHASNVAVMGITMYVIDVESGEIICSESISESVRATDTKVQAVYEGISFGGGMFYRTPLGRATAKVIRRAVRRITKGIASQPWEPKIALVRGDTVVINGGADRGLRSDTRLEVLERGAPIVDPDTGDVLGYQPGRRIGTVLVQQVEPLYAVARIIEGEAKEFGTGQYCRTVRQVAAR